MVVYVPFHIYITMPHNLLNDFYIPCILTERMPHGISRQMGKQHPFCATKKDRSNRAVLFGKRDVCFSIIF